MQYPRCPRVIIEDVTPPPRPSAFSREAILKLPPPPIDHHADMMDWYRWWWTNIIGG